MLTAWPGRRGRSPPTPTGTPATLLSRFNWLFLQIVRRLWVRASLFAMFGVLSALAAPLIAPFVPEGWSEVIDREALNNILEIIASSMLIVATFSLSTMVAAYAAASTITTPRVARLLMQDTTAQDALATFVGAFLFALVGIIALSSGVYNGNGRFVLFATTLVMVAAIVVTFLRWIDHASHLGRVGDAIERVAQKAETALRDRHEHPCLGGRAGHEPPAGSHPVQTDEVGYVQHIDMASLQQIADENDGEIHLLALPGTLTNPAVPLARTSFAPDDDCGAGITACFAIGAMRSFEQDPRYGLAVLAEIAAKALSPGINDPGTAIETIATASRVLAIWAGPREREEIRFPRVHVPGLATSDLFEDVFAPVSAYGAGSLMVGIRLQKALAGLERMGDAAFGAAAREQSALALARARAALALREEVERLEALAPGFERPGA